MTNIIYYYGIIFIITRIHTLFSRKTIQEVENKEILKTTLEDSLNTIKRNNLLPQFIMVCLNFLWLICGIIFTQEKTNNLVKWWLKLKNQAFNASKKPLLFFKYDRSKIFVVTETQPVNVEKYLYISWLNCYIILAEDWLKKEQIKWHL